MVPLSLSNALLSILLVILCQPTNISNSNNSPAPFQIPLHH